MTSRVLGGPVELCIEHSTVIKVTDDSSRIGRTVQLQAATINGVKQLAICLFSVVLHQSVYTWNSTIGQ